MLRAVWAAMWACGVASVGAAETRTIDDAAIADVGNTAEWLTYGRNHNEQRFSPLDQVNSENVAQLRLDWYLDVPDAVGLVSTPLVADGVMYFVGSRNIARAVDAVTGEVLWTYDPRVVEPWGAAATPGTG